MRALHARLRVSKPFVNWIKDRFEQFGFVGGQDFEVITDSGKNPQGGRQTRITC